MVRISAFGVLIFMAIALFTFQTKSLVLISVNVVVGAALLVPIIPVGIDFCGELTFPIEPTVCTGFLLMCAQGFGFILSLIVLKVSVINETYGILAIAVSALVASLVTVCIKEDLRRLQFSL